ncbi:hypothetical protein NE237_000903 [Protea cynaroides]|uniref:RING-CH-type domain-containing protein n=1 Tax=Protea cynaroides TaxID=273540 RepID=A0A9Q0KSA1_9MAGN|nr:hypothetical protein NE237_000903 [Protea cynaroides]
MPLSLLKTCKNMVGLSCYINSVLEFVKRGYAFKVFVKTPKKKMKLVMTSLKIGESDFGLPYIKWASGCRVINERNRRCGEGIPEEEAVCRICYVELGVGGETLRWSVAAKENLHLLKRVCTVEWFSIKSNMTCDVCKQDV